MTYIFIIEKVLHEMKFKERLFGSGHLDERSVWIIYERTSGGGRWYVGGSVGSGAERTRGESLRRQDLDPLR